MQQFKLCFIFVKILLDESPQSLKVSLYFVHPLAGNVQQDLDGILLVLTSPPTPNGECPA